MMALCDVGKHKQLKWPLEDKHLRCQIKHLRNASARNNILFSIFLFLSVEPLSEPFLVQWQLSLAEVCRPLFDFQHPSI